MSSEHSSFREMYDYPQSVRSPQPQKHQFATSRYKKGVMQNRNENKQTFEQVVAKTKNVVLFASKLKERIARKRTFNMHTLKANQLGFLQNDSQGEQKKTYFSHDSRAILISEIIFLLISVLYLWKITIQIVFGEMQDKGIITLIALFSFLIHITLFNFTEYKNEKQQLITNRVEIAQIYLSHKIIKDLIVVIMMIIQLTPLDFRQNFPILFIGIRMLSLVFFIQVRAVGERVQNQISVSNRAETVISLLKLVLKVFLFLHCLSIVLNLLAQFQSHSGVDKIWLTHNDLTYESNIQKYVIGWYWGATILSTVGFGQITPVNNFQRFFISIVQVTCCMTFGYFVNVIGSLIRVRAQSQQRYQKNVRSLNRCLNSLTVTNELKHKVRTHYFNKHIIQKIFDPSQERGVFQNLTPNLKTAVLEQNNINILKKSTFLQKLRGKTLLSLTQVVKRVIFAPQHILYSRSTKQRKLWFIQSGIIQEFTDNFQDSNLRKMISVYDQKQCTVGWLNFITQTSYSSLTKVKRFTVAYQLQQIKFLPIIKEDIRQYHKYLEMKHSMIQSNKRYISKCLSCSRYTHNVIDCPRIHFVKRQIYSLIEQYHHLNQFKGSLRKKKKIQRAATKYNWKSIFGTGELQKQANLLVNNDESRIDNGTIQNFIRNLALRQSSKKLQKIDKRKLSFLLSKQQDSKIQICQTNDLRQSAHMFSLDIVDEEELTLDTVFFNKQNKDYFSSHDIEQVLAAYAKLYPRRRMDAAVAFPFSKI